MIIYKNKEYLLHVLRAIGLFFVLAALLCLLWWAFFSDDFHFDRAVVFCVVFGLLGGVLAYAGAVYRRRTDRDGQDGEPESARRPAAGRLLLIWVCDFLIMTTIWWMTDWVDGGTQSLVKSLVYGSLVGFLGVGIELYQCRTKAR